MDSVHISIAKDFSKFPGGRYRTDGEFSGQALREEHLTPALKKGGMVFVHLEEALGYPASFLDEAFGRLPDEGFTSVDLDARLLFTGGGDRIPQIRQFIREREEHLNQLRSQGLFDKYEVKRRDGKPLAGDWCFVMALDDPIACEVLYEYAGKARLRGYSQLANDIRDKVMQWQGLMPFEETSETP